MCGGIPGKGMNAPLILILEDQPDIRRLLKIFISRFGGRVLEAESIAQASTLVELNRFDLAFLDYMLPDGLGVDVCKMLRTRSGMATIVMVTARGEPQVREELLAAGASQVVLKPFEHTVISEIMEAFTRGYAQRPH